MATTRHHHPKAAMPAPLSVDPTEEPLPVSADDAEISDVLENLDVSGAKVKVHRKAPGTQKFAYVDEYPAEGFTIEVLKSTYGGGEYRLGIHDARGRRIKRVDLLIDPRIKGTLDPQPAVLTPAAPVQSNDTLIQLMNQQQQSAQQMLILMMQSQQQQAQQMTQVLVAALTGAKAPATTSAGEPASRMLEAMMPLLLANVQKSGGSSGSMKEQIETLKALKDLLPEGGGKEEKEEDILDKVMKIGGPLMASLIGMRGGGGMPAPAQLPQVSVAPAPAPVQQVQQAPQSQPIPAPASTAALPADVQQMIGSLRQFIPVLVNAAAQNSECLTYHDLVADLLTDAQYDQLVEILKRPDWLTVLFADDPGVIQFRAWFESLRDPFINPDAYNDAPSPEPPAADAPGDAAGPEIRIP